MNVKKMMNAVEGMRKLSNTLSGDARELVEQFVAYAEGLEADSVEHNVTELQDKMAELVAAVAKTNEEVAEKIAKLRNEIAGSRAPRDVKDAFTPKVRMEIANAMLRARSLQGMEDAAQEVCKKNEITGISFADIVDYTLQIKQEDNDELFDELHKTNFTKFYVIDADPKDADAIAKQWNGLGVGVTEKAIQALAANGKTIATAEIYKRQRIANSVLDDVEEAGQAAEFEAEIRAELRKAVQGIAVRAALIGDTVNADGSDVDTFETIGTKTASDLFVTTMKPAGATPDLLDLRKAADAVKYDYKVAVMTAETKRALILRKYSSGATPILLTDAELAEQIGVNKVYTRDFIGEVDGLYAIVFNPREYWVKIKKERDIMYPQYEKNVLNYQYEKNMGGALHGIQSAAVLSANATSSSK